MKLWGGRFTKSIGKEADDFNSSIRFDHRLYSCDITGSMAHVRMLGKQGIIPRQDADSILQGLKSILEDIENGTLAVSFDAEDIHTWVESVLISRIGETGKKLHTGRSRNDQVALDMRMYVKDQLSVIHKMLLALEDVLLALASDHTDTIMPGYTHLQAAQPVTLAHHLMAYSQMFARDVDRVEDCYKRADVMPLGSGALAAVPYTLDREMVARELGFSRISENSLDAVSDRDFAIETASCISLIMMHLSRFCEEIIMWSSQQFCFVEPDDAYSTGSSIMPQKKNPDVAELIRGKSGRCFGNLVALLTVMKSLPLAYNKDMQEDKESLFDSIDTVKQCLEVFKGMLSTLAVNKEAMLSAARKGYINATDVADYLARKGVPFRTAHEIAGKLVLHCIDNNKNIEDLSIGELRAFSEIIEADIFKRISLETCVSVRDIPGGPSPGRVRESIEKGREFVNDRRNNI
jgi:argininosuccinate lyase